MARSEKFLRQTLNLPRTSFPMRAGAVEREPPMATRLTTQVYKRHRLRCAASQHDPAAGDVPRKRFVLHDGPPYANGSLHMGHYLNKVLKDISNRVALMSGRDVTYVPGWDCHGLPIELKALVAAGGNAARGGDHEGMDPSHIRQLARACAEEAIAEQREDLVRWGVLADWSGTPGSIYRTMDPHFEAAQLGMYGSCAMDVRR